MYSTRTNLILGFHGCERKDQEKLLRDINYFKSSKKDYDWLGHGMYFWEYNHLRADIWAKDKKKAGTLEFPAVIGAVIDLGYCFDLLNSTNILTLKSYYYSFLNDFKKLGLSIPENVDHPKIKSKDKILRKLDCAVIEYMHEKIREKSETPFDSIRAAFIEGDPIYPNAGFNEKNHIQICIINPNCIKGVFLPREKNKKYKSV